MMRNLGDQVERGLQQGQRWVNVWNLRNVDGQVNEEDSREKTNRCKIKATERVSGISTHTGQCAKFSKCGEWET